MEVKNLNTCIVLAHIPPRHEGWWKCPELQTGNGIASWHCKDEICQAKCEKNSWPLHNVENDGAFTKESILTLTLTGVDINHAGGWSL